MSSSAKQSVLSASIVLGFFSSGLLAKVDCSFFDSPVDQKVCRNIIENHHYANGRDWLNSVQKIVADTAITKDLLSTPGRLYIFDSRTADGQRAVYQFPAKMELPADSAIVSNGTAESKPLFQLDMSETGSQLSTPTEGYNVVANVEIRSQTGETYHDLFLVSEIDGITLTGVTLSADYNPSQSTTPSIMTLLALEYKSESNMKVLVENCDLLLPDVQGSQQITLIATRIQGSEPAPSDPTLTTAEFNNNRVFSENYNQPPGRINSAGWSVSGQVNLGSSRCNSIRDLQGNDLLSSGNYQTWLRCDNTPSDSQAIGFSNGNGWGWMLNDGQISYVYDTWASWSRKGVNISCGSGPTSPSDDSGLAVKIVVPVLAAFLVVSIAVTVFVGRRLWKTPGAAGGYAPLNG